MTTRGPVDPSAASGTHRWTRRRNQAVVLLAIASGSLDAIGIIALGGAFTSVMTGNMVLSGVAVAKSDLDLLLSAGFAIAAYIAGCALGARVAGGAGPDDEPWPAPVNRVLTLETVALVAFALGWWFQSGQPTETRQLVLLTINAIALGMQSSAVARFGVHGLSTTYLTGTLTSAVIHVVSIRSFRGAGHSAALVTGVVIGGAAGCLLVLRAPQLAPVLPVSCLIAVLITGLLIRRSPRYRQSAT